MGEHYIKKITKLPERNANFVCIEVEVKRRAI